MMDRFRRDHSEMSDDPTPGYELAGHSRGPALPGEVVVRPTIEEAMDALTADVLAQALSCVRAFGEFHLAVGGDESIEPLYMRLMSDPDLRAMPWKRTHLWITHERRVEADDPRRVMTPIEEFIVDHSDIPREQVHAIDVDADDAAERYERELRQTLAWRERGHDRLDCALVALERDGAAAGVDLTTPSATSEQDGALVVEIAAGRDGAPHAVALSEMFLNASRMIGMLAFGADRAPLISRISRNHRDGAGARPDPIAGELRWYLDEASCAEA